MKGLIVNTRPENYRERFHEAFGGLGWRIIDSPVLVSQPLHAVLPSADDFDSIIFTSQVAVDALPGKGDWRGKTAYAVGPATAAACLRAGFVHTIQTGLDAKDLASSLAAASFKKAFYPSAEEVSADLSLDDPARIQRMAIYRMSPAAQLSPEFRLAVGAEEALVVPLFSRRTARSFENLLKQAGIGRDDAHLVAVSISPDVLSADGGPWQRQVVADKPTLEAVVAKTSAVVANMNSEANQ